VYAHDQWTVTGKGDIKFDGSVADADEIQKRLLNQISKRSVSLFEKLADVSIRK
jgi:hypothetical protein